MKLDDFRAAVAKPTTHDGQVKVQLSGFKLVADESASTQLTVTGYTDGTISVAPKTHD